MRGADRYSGQTERKTGAYRSNPTGLKDLRDQERHPQTRGGVAAGPSFPWGHRGRKQLDSNGRIVSMAQHPHSGVNSQE